MAIIFNMHDKNFSKVFTVMILVIGISLDKVVVEVFQEYLVFLGLVKLRVFIYTMMSIIFIVYLMASLT